MKKFGIDISYWQQGYPYDAAKQEGVEYAIIRAGYSQTKDSMFETHYSNAKRVGWGVGAYWYLYSTTVDGAKAEARAFLKAIAGKQFDYPVYLDIEDSSIRGVGKDTLNAMIKAFGEIMESAGYYFGVYTNVDWYRNVISGSELNEKYDWWIACWASGKPTGINAGLWQFGGETNYIRSNKVAGVITDQNYAFKDYPSIIKELGKNGYSKISPVIPTPSKSIDDYAREVIAGKYGNGDVRKQKLKDEGQDYDTIQRRVNEILGINIPRKSNEEIAREVIDGKWSNASDRVARLKNAGYNPSVIQSLVNEMLKENQYVYYKIQYGDTLSGIASKYGTTYQKLAQMNGIVNPNIIQAGRTIRVK